MATPSTRKRLIARILIIAALLAGVWLVRHYQQSSTQLPQSVPTSNPTQTNTQNQYGVPDYVIRVLDYVRKNGEAPEGYVGGKEFQNREKRLPAKAPDGKRIRYSEWDVNPKQEGVNRGPERLVTGSDHSAWFTKDHYKTFKKIEKQ